MKGLIKSVIELMRAQESVDGTITDMIKSVRAVADRS